MTTLALLLALQPWTAMSPAHHNLVAFTTIHLLASDSEYRDLRRQAWRESRYNHRAVSSANCCGLFQIAPRWHKTTCDRLINDPVHSAVTALRVYRRMRVLCPGNFRPCYEMGPWHPSNRHLLASRYRE